MQVVEEPSGCLCMHKYGRTAGESQIERVLPRTTMTATTKLSQQLHRVAAQWPVDPFRPNLQLKTFFESLADHPQLTQQAVRAARALEENEFQKRVSPYSVCFNGVPVRRMFKM